LLLLLQNLSLAGLLLCYSGINSVFEALQRMSAKD